MRVSLFVFFSALAFIFNGFQTFGSDDRMAIRYQSFQITQLPYVAHPLQGFNGRVNSFLPLSSTKKVAFNFSLSNSNIWAPPAWALIPKNKAGADYLAQFPWHKRDSVYQAMPQQHDSIFFSADGIARNFQLSSNIKLAPKLMLHTTFRAMQLIGNPAVNPLVSDNNIENFHSNVLHQNDPFGRYQYPLNQAHLLFSDESGRVLEVKQGQFVFQGIDNVLKYNCLDKERLFNISGLIHTTINTSRFNRGLSIGSSILGYKKILLSKKKIIGLGLATGILKNNLVSSKQNVNIQTAPFLYTLQGQLDFVAQLANTHSIKITVAFDYRSANRNPKEYEYVVLSKAFQTSSFWHRGLSHQYENTQRWTLAITYGGRNKALTLYVMEDLKVDNLPDLQTGMIFTF